MSGYSVVYSSLLLTKVEHYLNEISSGSKQFGQLLKHRLPEYRKVDELTPSTIIQYLLETKLPQIFAESAVIGDGTDWTLDELSILGDIGVFVDVEIFDNALHYDPVKHAEPIKGSLMFIPGALLRSSNGVPADWTEITSYDDLNQHTYNQLYERRLLPLFLHANRVCEQRKQSAFITIPGIGCGQFSGPFHGRLGNKLKVAILTLLEKHASRLPNIHTVYFDPYSECANARYEIDHINYLIRPLNQGNHPLGQLCPPIAYEETGDDFSCCALFSVVAWDHVSWPGNDFYIGARMTDDGVKAAATDLMQRITGIAGVYDPQTNRYNPPKEYVNWEEVVIKNNLKFAQDVETFVY